MVPVADRNAFRIGSSYPVVKTPAAGTTSYSPCQTPQAITSAFFM